MEAIPDIFAQLANNFLVWIGFGTLVGLSAKAILPGRDPGGAFATVCLGICGCVLGAGTLAFFSEALRIKPLSPVGLIVAVTGAFILLILYRLLSGRLKGEPAPRGLRGAGRGRRKISVVEEE